MEKTTTTNGKKSEAGYHFANEKELAKNATARPDLFLECSVNLFLAMLRNTKGATSKTSAEVLALRGLALCSNLKTAFYRDCFEDVFSGAIDGAVKAAKEKCKAMSFCEDRNGRPIAPLDCHKGQ